MTSLELLRVFGNLGCVLQDMFAHRLLSTIQCR